MHTELEQQQAVARALRELPDDGARPYDWREFQRRAHAAPAAGARVARMRALAAVVVVGLAVMATAIRLGAGPRPQRPPATVAAQATPAEDDSAAEQWLETLPREPALVRVGTRAAIATLEDHIAQVDDLLSSESASRAPAARVNALQQERAQLVNSLVQVRYAETLADATR